MHTLLREVTHALTQDLVPQVVSDVKCIIQLGRVQVLKALLCVREQLHTTNSRYTTSPTSPTSPHFLRKILPR